MADIRRMTSADVDAVHKIGSNVEEFRVVEGSHHIFWPRETLEAITEKEIAFVVEDKSRIVGFSIATYSSTTRKLTWENMYLEQEYRKGTLVKECYALTEAEARKRGAAYACALVEESNISCQSSLQKLGFTGGKNHVWMEKVFSNG